MRYITKKELILPKRTKDSKKGDNGKVLVIGGSRDYVGAVALAGLAALRSGADWVTVAVPEKVGWAINALSPDLVVKKYKGDDFCANRANDILQNEEYKYNVILIGNGIGMHAASFVKKYLKDTKKPLVIDADAVNVMSIDWVDNSIITPHKIEFEHLLHNCGSKDKSDIQKKLKNNVIILKGPIDEVITKEKIFYNKTGNAGMTKAGTGDVLAGLAAGFYSQNKDALMAAKLAVYYNGRIGDMLLSRKKGFTYLASDMVDEIKRVIR